MENLKSYYHKAKAFCKKQVDKDPCLAKSVLIHISVVILLFILSFVSTLRFSSSTNFEIQVKGKPNQPQVIQATSITSQDLDEQIRSYEHNREQEKKALQDVKDARQDIKEARQKAMKQAKERAEAEAQRKAALEEKRKAEALVKRKEQQKQQELEKRKKIAEEQKQQKPEEQRKEELEKKKEADRQKAKQEAEKKRKQQELEKQRKARDARLAKARAEAIASAKREAQESARRQVQRSQTDSAIASYLGEYQQRIEDHWVRDNCRGIYKFPKAVARNGRFIKLTGTTGNFRCDQSLIDAIKDTTPPVMTNDLAKQRLQGENISFLFNPYK